MKGGCEVLAEWLEQMPDGTFPNITLIEGLLSCINNLNITTDNLEGSRLA